MNKHRHEYLENKYKRNKERKKNWKLHRQSLFYFFPLLRLTAFLFYFIFYTLKHKTTTKNFSLRIIWTLLYILPTFTLIYVIQQQQQSCRAGSGFLYEKKKHIYKNCKIQFFCCFHNIVHIMYMNIVLGTIASGTIFHIICSFFSFVMIIFCHPSFWTNRICGPFTHSRYGTMLVRLYFYHRSSV